MPNWNDPATWSAQYSRALKTRLGYRTTASVPTLHPAPAKYHWAEQSLGMEAVLDRQLALPGWSSVNRVALIGGAFGWGREYLVAQGIECYVVDTSTWINANWNVSEEAELRALMDVDPVYTSLGFGPGNNFFDNADCFLDPATGLPISGAAVWAKVLHPSGGRAYVAPSDEDLQTAQSSNRVKNRFSGSLDAIVTEQLLDGLDTEAEIAAICDGMERLKPNPACTRLHIVQPDPTSVLGVSLGLVDLATWKLWLQANGYSAHLVSDLKGNWL